jgi:UTP--glucose-1-phosphate uridylyltransferase
LGDVFEVQELIEKPSINEAPSNLAIAARYVLSPAIFDAIRHTQPGKGGEIQLTDAIRLLMQDGGKVFGTRLNGNEKRYDIGNFESYFNAFVEFALADEKYGDSLRKSLEEFLHAYHP